AASPSATSASVTPRSSAAKPGPNGTTSMPTSRLGLAKFSSKNPRAASGCQHCGHDTSLESVFFTRCSRRSPMALAAIPGVKQIGEAVINDAGDRPDHRQANAAREPAVARREPPDGDGAIGADVKVAAGIDRMQAAAHVLQTGAKAG